MNFKLKGHTPGTTHVRKVEGAPDTAAKLTSSGWCLLGEGESWIHCGWGVSGRFFGVASGIEYGVSRRRSEASPKVLPEGTTHINHMRGYETPAKLGRDGWSLYSSFTKNWGLFGWEPAGTFVDLADGMRWCINDGVAIYQKIDGNTYGLRIPTADSVPGELQFITWRDIATWKPSRLDRLDVEVSGFELDRLDTLLEGIDDDSGVDVTAADVRHLVRAVRTLQIKQLYGRPQRQVVGNLLPEIGSTVYIHLASKSEWVPVQVVGLHALHALEDLEQRYGVARVFVNVIHPCGAPNSRLISDIRLTAE